MIAYRGGAWIALNMCRNSSTVDELELRVKQLEQQLVAMLNLYKDEVPSYEFASPGTQ